MVLEDERRGRTQSDTAQHWPPPKHMLAQGLPSSPSLAGPAHPPSGVQKDKGEGLSASPAGPQLCLSREQHASPLPQGLIF